MRLRAAPKVDAMRINNSRLRTYSQCPRKFYWAYVHRPTDTNPGVSAGLATPWVDEKLAFGQLIHLLLADYYAERDWRNTLSNMSSMAAAGRDELSHEEHTLWRDNLDWAGRIMEEYEKHASVRDDFSVIQVECEGSATLGQICYTCGFAYAPQGTIQDQCHDCGSPVHKLVFKLDLLVNHQGDATFLDHKTTSGIGPAYLEKWAYEPQMQGYTLGTRSVGHPARKFLMNFIRKLKSIGEKELGRCPECKGGARRRIGCIRCEGVGKVEKPPAEMPFILKPYLVVEEAVERFEVNRIRQCNEISSSLKVHPSQDPLALWPMRTDACFDFGRCPYMRLCYSGDPEFWFDPLEELTMNFIPRAADYVTRMEKEEES